MFIVLSFEIAQLACPAWLRSFWKFYSWNSCLLIKRFWWHDVAEDEVSALLAVVLYSLLRITACQIIPSWYSSSTKAANYTSLWEQSSLDMMQMFQAWELSIRRWSSNNWMDIWQQIIWESTVFLCWAGLVGCYPYKRCQKALLVCDWYEAGMQMSLRYLRLESTSKHSMILPRSSGSWSGFNVTWQTSFGCLIKSTLLNFLSRGHQVLWASAGSGLMSSSFMNDATPAFWKETGRRIAPANMKDLASQNRVWHSHISSEANLWRTGESNRNKDGTVQRAFECCHPRNGSKLHA